MRHRRRGGSRGRHRRSGGGDRRDRGGGGGGVEDVGGVRGDARLHGGREHDRSAVRAARGRPPARLRVQARGNRREEGEDRRRLARDDVRRHGPGPDRGATRGNPDARVDGRRERGTLVQHPAGGDDDARAGDEAQARTRGRPDRRDDRENREIPRKPGGGGPDEAQPGGGGGASVPPGRKGAGGEGGDESGVLRGLDPGSGRHQGVGREDRRRGARGKR